MDRENQNRRQNRQSDIDRSLTEKAIDMDERLRKNKTHQSTTGNEQVTDELDSRTDEIDHQTDADFAQFKAGLEFLHQVKLDVRRQQSKDAETINRADSNTDAGVIESASEAEFELDVLGRFEIMDVIGEGGFAKVYLANDPVLERPVALKIPKPHALISNESRTRFQREARSAALLSHPSIVAVFEAGEIGPVTYIATEYCDGQTLGEWFTQRNNSVDAICAAQIVAKLAEAIEHAHQRGIVHRDIKPGNILVQHGDTPVAQRVRITDFGLSRSLDADDQTLTREGAIIGTPAYMSPEQAAARNTDFATDIYSLGVIFYELLTGQRPHTGSSHLAVIKAVENDEPRQPRRINAAIPKDLEAICLKCLEKKPQRRYASAFDLASDLENWLEGRTVVARPVRAPEKLVRWCRRNTSLATAIGLAIAILLGGISTTTWKWLESNRNLSLAKDETKRANDATVAANKAKAKAIEEGQRALMSANRTKGVLETVRSSFRSVHPSLGGDPNMKARDVVQNARAALESGNLDDEGKSLLLETIFESLMGIGEYHLAVEAGEQWLQINQGLFGNSAQQTMAAANQLAMTLSKTGRIDEALEIQKKLVNSETNSEIERLRFQLGLGEIYRHRGNLIRATDIVEQVWSQLQGYAGEHHLLVLETQITLANLYVTVEKTDDAEQLIDQAEETFVQNFDQDDTIQYQIQLTKNEVLKLRGDYEKATTASEQLWDTCKQKLGEEHPVTLIAEGEFANSLVSDSQHAIAQKHYQHVYSESVKQFGESHPNSITALAAMANWMRKNDDLTGAIKDLKHVLKLRRKHFPEMHGAIQIDENRLAECYIALGGRTANDKLIKEALDLISDFKQSQLEYLPPDHSQITLTSNNIANAHYALFKRDKSRKNNLKAALSELEKLNEMLIKKYPDGSPQLRTVRGNLAVCYSENGQYKEASALFRKVLANDAGDSTFYIQAINLSANLMRQGNTKEAVDLLQDTVDQIENTLPKDHQISINAKAQLARSLRQAGQLDQAIQAFRDLLDYGAKDRRLNGVFVELRACLLEAKRGDEYVKAAYDELDRAYGEDKDKQPVNYSQLMLLMSSDFLKLGKVDEAIKLRREALEIREGVDPNAWFTHYTKAWIASALVEARQFDEAQKLMDEAYEKLSSNPESIPLGTRKAAILNVMKRQMLLARAKDDQPAVAQWQEKMDELSK